MDQRLLHEQALAGAAFQAASAPPAPGGHHEAMPREQVDNVELVRGGLVEMGVPWGLAGLVAKEDRQIGLRLYVLDNSGSTAASDGSVVRAGASGRLCRTQCTRWDEICAMAMEHAKWNLKVGTPCEFILLNSLGRAPGAPMMEGRDCVHIDRSRGPESSQLQELHQLLENNAPRGVTPITERLLDIRSRVLTEFAALAQAGQRIFLTIVTDGLPTSPTSGVSTQADRMTMIETLRGLGSLGLQLVIRLCTDEEETISFYNKIDEEIEFPIDILDDMSGEAVEVANHGNDWFAYTPELHRIREAGTLSKILDDIDERALNVIEVQKLAELLCGAQQSLTGLSKREFLNEVRNTVAGMPLVYDARRQAMRPVVDIARLRVALKMGFRGWLLPKACPCFF